MPMSVRHRSRAFRPPGLENTCASGPVIAAGAAGPASPNFRTVDALLTGTVAGPGDYHPMAPFAV
jgi:inactivated superfamily I helicase